MSRQKIVSGPIVTGPGGKAVLDAAIALRTEECAILEQCVCASEETPPGIGNKLETCADDVGDMLEIRAALAAAA